MLAPLRAGFLKPGSHLHLLGCPVLQPSSGPLPRPYAFPTHPSAMALGQGHVEWVAAFQFSCHGAGESVRGSPRELDAALLPHLLRWLGKGRARGSALSPVRPGPSNGRELSFPSCSSYSYPPTKRAGRSGAAGHGDHIMTLLTWRAQRGTKAKLEWAVSTPCDQTPRQEWRSWSEQA